MVAVARLATRLATVALTLFAAGAVVSRAADGAAAAAPPAPPAAPAPSVPTAPAPSAAPVAPAPAAAAAHVAAPAAPVAPHEWEGVARVVAVGDVHGAADKLVDVLRGAGLVDAETHWSGGQDHLVMLGDLIDRGPGDRAVLDLAHRLQHEAGKAGGRVHVLLGNHEVMNLVRDLRYVSAASFAEFSDLERASDREKALRKFANPRRHNGESVKAIQAAFDAEHPYGYFGRLRAFGPGGPYADWLLEQPAMVKVNGVVYVHGGLTEDFARRGLADVNREVAKAVRSFWKLREMLDLSPFARYEEVQRAALEITRYGGSDEKQVVARQLIELQQTAAFSSAGPLWYRGLSLENERAEADVLEAALAALKARAVVVGHTPTKTGAVQSRFKGRVYRVDASLLGSDHPAALVEEGGAFTVLDPATAQRAAAPAEAPWGELWTAGMADLADPELERYLETADATDVRPLGKGSTRPRLVEMRRQGLRLRGVFKDRSDAGSQGQPANRFQHEIAAYAVDRLLGFHLVPDTVARRLDKTWGSMQQWIEAAVTPETADAYALAYKIGRTCYSS